jgi:hypothetical protein
LNTSHLADELSKTQILGWDLIQRTFVPAARSKELVAGKLALGVFYCGLKHEGEAALPSRAGGGSDEEEVEVEQSEVGEGLPGVVWAEMTKSMGFAWVVGQ